MKCLKLICLIVLMCCNSVWAMDVSDVVNIRAYRKVEDNKTNVLLELNIADGWHIFAPFEQQFGAPLNVDWKQIDQQQIIDEAYSMPRQFDVEEFSYFGYDKKAFYQVVLTNVETDMLVAKASWQVCADGECVQQQRTISDFSSDSKLFDNKFNNAARYFENYDFGDNVIIFSIMALIGGIILNFMPCVFPILGIKIITLSKMQRSERYNEALFYAVGVVMSMIVVAAILWGLRKFDVSVGWGFQLQSPYFVTAMLVMFAVLALMMIGVININSAWIQRLAGIRFTNVKVNAFMTGLLAVLVATPCTAPFMGAAIGYALMSPSYIYFPLFIFLGIGYSLPYILIATNPLGIKKILPRSGKWMNILKKILSIPLIMTCFWLAWLLGIQLKGNDAKTNLKWNDYSRQSVEHTLAQNKPVFIDFTANWCITCLVNKKAALQSDTMIKLVEKNGIVLYRADATVKNKEVGLGLASYGRASVPLYVYYDAKSDGYSILPQILTPTILERYLR